MLSSPYASQVTFPRLFPPNLEAQALSEFTEYVEKQQALHAARRAQARGTSVVPSDIGHSTRSRPAVTEDHPELDILDQLGLSDDNTKPVKLKGLLLDT